MTVGLVTAIELMVGFGPGSGVESLVNFAVRAVLPSAANVYVASVETAVSLAVVNQPLNV